MSALRTFLDMDGYGGFVWPAYAITLLVLGIMLAASWRRLRRREAALETLREAARAGRGEPTP